jgi:hypothetical protein
MWSSFVKDKNPDCIEVHKQFLQAGVVVPVKILKSDGAGGYEIQTIENHFILPGFMFKYKDIYEIERIFTMYGRDVSTLIFLDGQWEQYFIKLEIPDLDLYTEVHAKVTVCRFLDQDTQGYGLEYSRLKYNAMTGPYWPLNFEDNVFENTQYPMGVQFAEEVKTFLYHTTSEQEMQTFNEFKESIEAKKIQLSSKAEHQGYKRGRSNDFGR